MECRKEENLTRCPCPSTSCNRKGVCCQCLAGHLSRRELPACVFPTQGGPYERSFESFARLVTSGAA